MNMTSTPILWKMPLYISGGGEGAACSRASLEAGRERRAARLRESRTSCVCVCDRERERERVRERERERVREREKERERE